MSNEESIFGSVDVCWSSSISIYSLFFFDDNHDYNYAIIVLDENARNL